MVYYDRFKDRVHTAEYSKVSIGADEATRAFAAKEIQELKDLDPGPPPVIPDLPDLSGLVAKDPFSFDDDVEDADSTPKAIKADTGHIENDYEAVKKEEVKDVDGSDSDDDEDPSDEDAVRDASVMRRNIREKSFNAYVKAMQIHNKRYKAWQSNKDRYDAFHKQVARDLYLGMLFVVNACKNRFGSYQKALHDDFLDGFFHYPLSPEDGLRLRTERSADAQASGVAHADGSPSRECRTS
jgi:hypothetical protein